MAVPASSLIEANVLIATLDASLSVIVAVAVGVAMVATPITLLNVAVNVSASSAMASSDKVTVNVLVVPVGEFAGKVKVPVAAVKSVPLVAVPVSYTHLTLPTSDLV